MSPNKNNQDNICPVCKKSFSSKNALKQHCQSTNHTLNILCPHCNKTFGTQQARDQHISSVHKKKKHDCSHCNKKFKSPEALNQHIALVHEKTKCPYCDKTLKNSQGLQQHISNVHEFKCPHCSEKLFSRLLLQKHIEENHNEKLVESFICHTCKKVLKTEEALKQHMQSIGHQVELLESPICPHCKQEFKTKNDLKQHLSNTKHTLTSQGPPEDEFLCPICERPFNSSNALTQHIAMKHKESQKEISIKTKGIALFEKQTLRELLVNFCKRLLNKKRVIIMDECVGNDSTIIDALGDQYDVRPLPKTLLGHGDRDLRLAFREKNWGLVSKDYEMVMLAREMKIKPVYLLTEKRKHRDLIRISKRNYKVN